MRAGPVWASQLLWQRSTGAGCSARPGQLQRPSCVLRLLCIGAAACTAGDHLPPLHTRLFQACNDGMPSLQAWNKLVQHTKDVLLSLSCRVTASVAKWLHRLGYAGCLGEVCPASFECECLCMLQAEQPPAFGGAGFGAPAQNGFTFGAQQPAALGASFGECCCSRMRFMQAVQQHYVQLTACLVPVIAFVQVSGSAGCSLS